jgi:phage portal protein BeeE
VNIRNLFKRKRTPELKGAVPQRIQVYNFGLDGGDSSQGNDYAGMAKLGYQGNADVYSAVKRYGEALGSIPWIVRKRTPNKRRTDWEIIDDHPFYELWERPNPTQTQTEWMQQFAMHHWLSGEVFINISGTLPSQSEENQGRKIGIPAELWLPRPDHIKSIKANEESTEIEAFMLQADAKKDPEPWPAVNVEGKSVTGDTFYTRFVNPLDKWRGMSPFVPAQLGIKIGSDGRTWDLNMMQAGGRPSGMLIVAEDENTETQRREIVRQYNEKNGGLENVGAPVMAWGLTEDGTPLMQWVEMGKTPKDMDWIEAITLSKRDVSNVTGVPMPLLADYSDATLNNVSEAYDQFWLLGVLPYADMIRDAFNAYLLPFYGDDVWLDYDKTEISALQEDLNEVYARLKEADYLTVDEKRDQVGMEPLPNGKGNVLILTASDFPTAPDELGEMSAGIDPSPVDDEVEA